MNRNQRKIKKLKQRKVYIFFYKGKSTKGTNNIIDTKFTKQYQGSPYKIDNKVFLEKNEVQPPLIIEEKISNDLSDTQKEKEKKFVETISNLSPIKQSKMTIIFKIMIKFFSKRNQANR